MTTDLTRIMKSIAIIMQSTMRYPVHWHIPVYIFEKTDLFEKYTIIVLNHSFPVALFFPRENCCVIYY